MIVTKESSPVLKKTHDYWEMSRAWNRKDTQHNWTVGSLLTGLRNLTELTDMQTRLQHRTHLLLTQVIFSKRCRKSKGTNNLVFLNGARRSQGSSDSEVQDVRIAQ